jgi:hypothetical protein
MQEQIRALACWVVRNRHDAVDIVQEAHLGAFRFFGGCQAGRDARALGLLRSCGIRRLHPENNRPARLSAEETLRQRFRLKTMKKAGR